jgi:hypothetical protein
LKCNSYNTKLEEYIHINWCIWKKGKFDGDKIFQNIFMKKPHSPVALAQLPDNAVNHLMGKTG